MTREEAIAKIWHCIVSIRDCIGNKEFVEALELSIDTMRKYQQLEDFAKWVAGEIIDEDMWALNYLAFAELSCRKLVKLGIMQESNGKYIYEEVTKSQEPTTKNDSRVDYTINSLDDFIEFGKKAFGVELAIKKSATPQESQTFKWCTDCREYDQEKHCCHRWSKVIRDTVAEMKQEYIEREVLDKIRAEIIELRSRQNVGVLECLDIIDKYKAE